MALLDLSVLSDLQVRQATNEKFRANYGMIDLAKDSTPFIDYIPPSVMEELSKMSGARDAILPALVDQAVTVGTTPGFANIPSNLATSGVYNFTAVDVFSGFRIYPSQFENSTMDAAWYRDQVLMNVLQEMAVTIGDLIEVQLEARKTQVLNYVAQVSQGDGTFTFNTGVDTLEISKAAVLEVMYYNLINLMQANQLGGGYRLVTSPAGLVSGISEAQQLGANNASNLAWNQANMPADRLYQSDQLAVGSDIFNGFFVRDGDIGLIENYPVDFRAGTVLGGKKWSVSDVELPFTRMRANIFINSEATDATSIVTPNDSTNTDLIMTTWEEMAIWHRFYIPYRYNSAIGTRQNAIVKVSGKTS